MNNKEALNVIAQALGTVKATLQEHQILQEAMRTLQQEDLKKEDTSNE